MSWTTPAVSEILSEFTPSEKSAISAVQEDTADVNLAAIGARVTAEIRDYIRSGGYALDSTTTTLPAGLHNDWLSIARWRFLASIPALSGLVTDARKDAYKDALAKMEKIAAQKFSVEPPSVSASASRSGNWNSENKIVPRTHPVPRPGTQYSPQTGRYANPDAPEDKTL